MLIQAMICIQVVPGSNLGQDPNYFEDFVVFLNPSMKMHGSTSNHAAFLHLLSKSFFINHHIIRRSGSLSWVTDSNVIQTTKFILSRVEGVVRVTSKTGSGLDDRIIDTLFLQPGTTGNTALSPIYTLYSSPLHTQ
jgi:hypothetical protein